jgi:capsular polysaccharide biosynthesis protein
VATAISSTPEIRLLRRFRRQWPIAVAGVIATVVLCAATLHIVPPTYTTKASLLLTPPPTPASVSTTGNPNPYMQLGGLQPLADIVSRAMMSSSSLATLRKAGLDGSYTVARDTTTDGPIVTVTTKAKTPAAALTDMRLVLNLAGPQLNNLQANQGVVDKNRVTTTVVARDTQAGTSRKSQIRALVVALVAGLVGTALAVSVVDLLMQRRRKPKQAGRAIRRLTTAPAPGQARADAAPSSFSARAMLRPGHLVRAMTRNGHAGAAAPDGSSAPATADTAIGSGESAVEPSVRARRRPLPGRASDVPEAPPPTARIRRRARGSAQQAGSVPESDADPDDRESDADPDDRVASRLP